MGDQSKIEWTDATWNPVTGCTRVSEGCRSCYIERTPAFRIAGRKFAHGTTGVQLHPDRLDQPLKWKKPRRIFVNSLSDLFHEDVPQEFIVSVYASMIAAWWHTFQILTKRPTKREFLLKHQIFRRDVAQAAAGLINKMRGGLSYQGTVNLAAWEAGFARNIHEGVSIEDQATADERIPLLLNTPSAVRFVSYEPALGPVDIKWWLQKKFLAPGVLNGRAFVKSGYEKLDWVIAGGESGPGARPMHPAWARSIRDQCQTAGVPFFFKQWGEWAPGDEVDPGTGEGLRFHYWAAPHAPGKMWRFGKKSAGSMLDGREHKEWPR